MADSGVGIAALLDRIKLNDFKDDLLPTTREDITAHVEIGRKTVKYIYSLHTFSHNVRAREHKSFSWF